MANTFNLDIVNDYYSGQATPQQATINTTTVTIVNNVVASDTLLNNIPENVFEQVAREATNPLLTGNDNSTISTTVTTTTSKVKHQVDSAVKRSKLLSSNRDSLTKRNSPGNEGSRKRNRFNNNNFTHHPFAFLDPADINHPGYKNEISNFHFYYDPVIDQLCTTFVDRQFRVNATTTNKKKKNKGGSSGKKNNNKRKDKETQKENVKKVGGISKELRKRLKKSHPEGIVKRYEDELIDYMDKLKLPSHGPKKQNNKKPLKEQQQQQQQQQQQLQLLQEQQLLQEKQKPFQKQQKQLDLGSENFIVKEITNPPKNQRRNSDEWIVVSSDSNDDYSNIEDELDYELVEEDDDVILVHDSNSGCGDNSNDGKNGDINKSGNTVNSVINSNTNISNREKKRTNQLDKEIIINVGDSNRNNENNVIIDPEINPNTSPNVNNPNETTLTENIKPFLIWELDDKFSRWIIHVMCNYYEMASISVDNNNKRLTYICHPTCLPPKNEVFKPEKIGLIEKNVRRKIRLPEKTFFDYLFL